VTSEDYERRGAAIFQAAKRDIEADLNAMAADHAARGRLQSGVTARRAITIYEEQTGLALQRALDEAAKLIDHHGRKWDGAMAGIRAALEKHLAAAPEILRIPFKHATLDKSPDAQKAADQLVSEAADRLRSLHSEFRGGWTAPAPKAWKERHPLLFQMILLAIGGVIALGGSIATGLLKVK
jgi:hypothetical protein